MTKYVPGDDVSRYDIGFNLVPAGTVVQGSKTTFPRVVANPDENNGYIFTDKGPMPDESFVVISVPADSQDTSNLAETLFFAGFNDDMNDFRIFVNEDVWERRAQFVRDNFVRNGDVVVVIDDDDDTWFPEKDSNLFTGPYGEQLTYPTIEDAYGVKTTIRAGE